MFPPAWHTQNRSLGPCKVKIDFWPDASPTQGAQDGEPPSVGTLASAAHARVRAEILAGVIAPGSRLHIRELCGRLGIGLSPMREALNRLSTQGLVTQSDQRGFTAAPLDLADLADLTQARAAINAAALRDALGHGDAAWEEALLLAHHRLARTPRQGAADAAWEARHATFHAALLAGCRSARLRRYAEQLFAMADRYRLVSRAGGDRRRDVAGEHAAILHAALARDAERATALLDEHVGRTEALVRAALLERSPTGRAHREVAR